MSGDSGITGVTLGCPDPGFVQGRADFSRSAGWPGQVPAPDSGSQEVQAGGFECWPQLLDAGSKSSPGSGPTPPSMWAFSVMLPVAVASAEVLCAR